MNGSGQTGQVMRDQYDRMAAQRLIELRRQKGWIHWIVTRVFRWFSGGIAAEARDDWLRVRRKVDAIKARLFEAGGASPEEADYLATASAYLELARYSRDLAEAWGFVNQADEVVCKLTSSPATQVTRLDSWEPLLAHWLSELYDDKDLVDQLKQCRDGSKTDPCNAISVHSQQWTLINHWISFSRKLWSLGVWILFVALVLAIGVTEIIVPPATELPPTTVSPTTTEAPTTTVIAIPLPYVTIAVLGLFGGALSALLSARSRKVTAITYGQNKSRIIMRLLLGAAGAYVMYVLVTLPGLMNDKVSGYLTTPQGFIALGIVAGFSERLFQDTLERLAEKFPTTDAKSG